MKTAVKIKYDVWYRVTSGQGFVEVTLFVENEGGETLVAQQEGFFNTMEDAEYLINHLQEIGADVRFSTSEAYTGGQD